MSATNQAPTPTIYCTLCGKWHPNVTNGCDYVSNNPLPARPLVLLSLRFPGDAHELSVGLPSDPYDDDIEQVAHDLIRTFLQLVRRDARVTTL